MKLKLKKLLTPLAALIATSLGQQALAQAPGQPSAIIKVKCDRECLIGFARGYIKALASHDADSAHLAPNVIFSENDVTMPVGNDGLWGTISKVRDGALEVADKQTGNAAWFGIVEEHGKPAYLAMRIKVENNLITQIETVVNRLPDMPKPFGDPDKVSHDPTWNDILSSDEHRPRERLLTIADGYFNTVELNDGQVFTEFADDCGRLENGISTTSNTNTGSGNSSSIAQGCEAQFRLGIYRINKRIRDRRYPLIDEERGIVVASGFFDHANTFDHYKLTDGREMKTVLKWPNSISLIEAFKIRSGKISRIEAVFTYVPYFMPSPFAVPNVDWQTR